MGSTEVEGLSGAFACSVELSPLEYQCVSLQGDVCVVLTAVHLG